MNSKSEQIALLDEWMNAKEGENFEFKRAAERFSFDELCQYSAALANEGGGKILLGVTNERPRKALGSKAFPQPEEARQGLRQRIPLNIDFEEIHHPDCVPGSRVLVFHIPSRPLGMPIKHDGRYWMREADSLVEMSEDRLRRIFEESGRDFSAEFCESVSGADLDPAAISEFRRLWIAKTNAAGNSTGATHLRALSDEQLLEDAEAVVGGKTTFAALILFGRPETLRDHLPQAEVVFEYRSADKPGPAQERSEYRKGFFAYYDELWGQINKRNDQQEFQEGLFVGTISTFSERTVREAILNAVSHRNYQLSGSIFVRQYSRRLEIDSPGGLPVGITLANILDRQNARNRRIAEILTKCGLVERSGQGMNLIYEELIKQSKPAPDFSRTDDYQVGLTLHGMVENPAFVRFVEKVGKESSATFDTHDWMILSQIARGEKPEKEQAKRTSRLLELGLIERAKGRTFVLARRYYDMAGQRGVYTRRKGLDREQNLALLLKHLESRRETGCQLAELCQVLPSLKLTHVQSLLRALKDRKQAHSIGKTRAGTWFPGPPSSQDEGSGDV